MKIITEPTVHLVAIQAFNIPGKRSFLKELGVESFEDDADNCGDALPEWAGRLCYLSYARPRPGGNEAYLKHIKEVGHGSVLEHAVYSFVFTGVSRSLTHELVRHRAGLSYSELSQRYVDCSDVDFVLPPALKAHYLLCKEHEGVVGKVGEDLLKARALTYVWQDVLFKALTAYEDLCELLEASSPPELLGTDKRKWARQAARSVLPNCAETKVFVTGNARAFRNFLELRCSRHADAEIRVLAGKLYEKLLEESPNLFSDYRKEPLPDGTYGLDTPYKKV